MSQHNASNEPKEQEKSITLEDTIIYTEIKKRNSRLLITAISLLGTALALSIMFVLDRNIFLLAGAVIFLIASIWQFVLVFQRNENIFRHPDMVRFLKWGENYGSYIIAIDEELRQSKRTQFSKVFFTDSFAFIPTFYGFGWFHFSEVCWAFNHVTKHSVNFIPTGTDYEVHVYLDYGFRAIPSNKSEKLLEHIFQMAPFAHYGYSDELKNVWSNDPAGFIADVKQRMNQFLSDPDKFVKENLESVEDEKLK